MIRVTRVTSATTAKVSFPQSLNILKDDRLFTVKSLEAMTVEDLTEWSEMIIADSGAMGDELITRIAHAVHDVIHSQEEVTELMPSEE